MKVLKHKKSGNFYEECNWSEPFSDDTIKVYPLGGGFVGSVKKDDLEEVEMPTDTVFGWATIDDDKFAYRCTYNPVAKWNGWDQPAFHHSVLDRIAREWNMRIVELEDEFYMIDKDADLDPVSADEGIHLLRHDEMWGMDGVCWICCGNDEISEGHLLIRGDDPH